MNYENTIASKRKSSLPDTHFVNGSVYTNKAIFQKVKKQSSGTKKVPAELDGLGKSGNIKKAIERAKQR